MNDNNYHLSYCSAERSGEHALEVNMLKDNYYGGFGITFNADGLKDTAFWYELPKLPEPLINPTAVVTDQYIFVFGGKNSSGVATNKTYRIN